MRKYILFFLLFLYSLISVSGQEFNGTIEFDRTTNWLNIYSKFSFLTPEQIEREKIVWGNLSGPYSVKYTLQVNDQKTFYKQKPITENQGYGSMTEEEFFYRDLKEKTQTDLVTLGDKVYLLKGDIPRLKWKIQNEIRDIQGYICMKATTTHPAYGTPVTAWYTSAIPVNSGPEGFGGLPGMILSLAINEDDVIIEASKITPTTEPTEIVLPKKMKGKASTPEKYNEEKMAFVEKSFKGKKNPYNYIRY